MKNPPWPSPLETEIESFSSPSPTQAPPTPPPRHPRSPPPPPPPPPPRRRIMLDASVILFPIAITFYITWWFIHFMDGFFSPIYAQLGIDIFGLGFITSITFIFLVGVFMSSWLGASVLGLGEWFIKQMPLVCHIYNASKQISAAISPDQNTQAFKEVAIIRHPRVGEYAFGFITSSVTLQNYAGDEELCCVYVPTNHLYIGDIFLVNTNDIIRPNLSVREGIEIVVSGGMSMPQILSTIDSRIIPGDISRTNRS